MPRKSTQSRPLGESEWSDDQPLGLLLHRAQSALRAEVTVRALKRSGLAFPEYMCMRLLSQSPGKSNAELARDLNVLPQATSGVVRGLQQRGLLMRPHSASSGRSLPARLTGHGLDILMRTEAGVRAAEDSILPKLTPQERHSLRRLLNALG
jgi:DNA-binding MarR family transcriptional regulator